MYLTLGHYDFDTSADIVSWIMGLARVVINSTAVYESVAGAQFSRAERTQRACVRQKTAWHSTWACLTSETSLGLVEYRKAWVTIEPSDVDDWRDQNSIKGKVKVL